MLFSKDRTCVSKKVRDFAKGRDCELQIPGVCNHDPSTTVLCHYRMFGNAGVGQKPHDFHGAFGCTSCHDVLDRRRKRDAAPIDGFDLLRAMMRTQDALYQAGLLMVKGDKG